MRVYCYIIFCCSLITAGYTQQLDVEFSRKGLLLFKELGMVSSHVIDFDVTIDSKINVLYESDSKKNLIRLQGNGQKDIQFSITESNLNNEYTIPVAIGSRLDGSVLVLSNFWNGHSWMISVNGFYENGNIDQEFGISGAYRKDILDNFNDNYGQYIYVSSKGEIIVVAKIKDQNASKGTERIAILKLSDIGETVSSKLYDEKYFTLNCAAMEDDYLLLGYSESVDDGLEQATYLVGFDSDQMTPDRLDCRTIEEGYQSFDHIVFSNTELFASRIENEAEGLYPVLKYNANGNLDESFYDSGEMGYKADIYNTDFVVNEKGEVFIVSTSIDSDFEILIKKLSSNGDLDVSFGDGGMASILLRYPINDLTKIRLDQNNGLYISGDMNVEGDSYGFITRLKLNVRQLKKEKLDKFLNELFVKE